jgi:DNA-binding Lrp family transcriptional regulator
MIERQDEHILAQLQREGRTTNQQLAEDVGMSTSACWRRVRALEEAGVIVGYAALVDREKTGRRRALPPPPSCTCRSSGTTRNSSTNLFHV